MKTVATELQIRYKTRANNKMICDSPQQCYHEVMCINDFKDNIDLHEMFYVICLDRALHVNGILKVSEGGIDFTTVDIRIIIQAALLSNSPNIVVIHNHPSGCTKMSKSDKNLSDKIANACELMNINYLDFIIATRNNFESYPNNKTNNL